MERMKSEGTDIKSIKDEDIQEEIKDDESVDDPSSLIYSTESYIKQEIKQEVDDGHCVDDTDNLVDSSK